MAQELLPPQLITNARMLYFCWVPADPATTAALLPAGLTPAQDKAIYINQYCVDTDAQTSHFGAYSLTYMGLDLAAFIDAFRDFANSSPSSPEERPRIELAL